MLYFFKVAITGEEDFIIALEHELLSLNYETLVDVAQGLKTVTEHLIKVIIHNIISINYIQ